jgi:CheY-like chemotaxis protein
VASVLVIDDDPDIRMLVEIAMERAGHEVQLASGGAEGLAVLRDRDGSPPVVVLDGQMPVLDGWEVLAAIRADDSLLDVPVILCTVQASPTDLARGWETGCDAYLTKPFDIAAMADEVTTLSELSLEDLERRRAERRLAPPIGLGPAGEAQRR